MFSMRLQLGRSPRAVILTGKGFAPSMQARFTTHVLNENRALPAHKGVSAKSGLEKVKTLPLETPPDKNLTSQTVISLTVAPCIRISAQ